MIKIDKLRIKVVSDAGKQTDSESRVPSSLILWWELQQGKIRGKQKLKKES